MTLSPKLGGVEISTLWHFRLPLLVQMFIRVASSPRLSGIGMPSPILWSVVDAEDCVAKFTSMVRTRDPFPNHRSWWVIVVSAFHQQTILILILILPVVYSFRYFVGPLYMHLLYYRLGSFEKALFHLAKKRFVWHLVIWFHAVGCFIWKFFLLFDITECLIWISILSCDVTDFFHDLKMHYFISNLHVLFENIIWRFPPSIWTSLLCCHWTGSYSGPCHTDFQWLVWCWRWSMLYFLIVAHKTSCHILA